MDPERPWPPLRVPPELIALHRRRACELRAAARRDFWRWIRRAMRRLLRRR